VSQPHGYSAAPEGLDKLKKFNKSSGIEPTNFRLVAYSPYKLSYFIIIIIIIIIIITVTMINFVGFRMGVKLGL
jgi:hypothetical protein